MLLLEVNTVIAENKAERLEDKCETVECIKQGHTVTDKESSYRIWYLTKKITKRKSEKIEGSIIYNKP